MMVLAVLISQAMSAIPTLKLNNGVDMPAVAAGTWQYDSTYAQQSVVSALNAGFTHIDSAHDYCSDGSTAKFGGHGCPDGSNQLGIAKALANRPRADFFLTTKVPGCGLQGISRDSCGPDSVAAANKNLQELKLAYTDLLLIHFPPLLGCGPSNCAAIRQQWAALTKELLLTNKTRALGVSNFCVSCLKCLEDTPGGALTPAVNQFKYHIGMGADPGGLVSYCKAKGVVPQAYSPLGDNTTELISGPLVSKLGQAHGKSGVQVALRWIWQHGVAVLTKSGNPAHLKQDLDLFDWSLTAGEMASADAATTPTGTPSFMCKA
jgi:2,5-diketo-D-gluconate reductase A